MDQEKKIIQKLMSLVPSKRTLRSQCIPIRSEEEVNRELEEFVKTYDPAMESIQYHLTHVPSKGILKRSSFFKSQPSVHVSPNEKKASARLTKKDIVSAVDDSTTPTADDTTDEEENSKLFPTVKDSLEILLKKKSSISARKSILKNPSRTSNITSTVNLQQTSDDDEMSLLTKFPAKDSMEILIKKSKSCLRVSEAGEGVDHKSEDAKNNDNTKTRILKVNMELSDDELEIIEPQDFKQKGGK